jgi:murein DD-endopeptidase MepM/ murein hydrolase activator NlpD
LIKIPTIDHKFIVRIFYCILSLILLFAGCDRIDIPKEKYHQFYSNSSVTIKNDTMFCALSNPLDCPLRIYISTSDSLLNKSVPHLHPITLQPRTDTLLQVKVDAANSDKIKTFWRTALGDPKSAITYNKISLPFCRGRSYKIIQGYNGWHSHDNDYHRFAIDFDLKINDTICAADDGFVVGLINDYKVGGNDKRLEPFANWITLYHPHAGLYTQYAHLKYHGSLVKLGDVVKQGQAIGLAGVTGRTSGEHLHFNVLIPTDDMLFLKSVPIEFVENYIGKDLSEDDVVKK